MEKWFTARKQKLGERLPKPPVDAYDYAPAMISIQFDDGSGTICYAASVVHEKEARDKGTHLGDPFFANMPDEAMKYLLGRVKRKESRR